MRYLTVGEVAHRGRPAARRGTAGLGCRPPGAERVRRGRLSLYTKTAALFESLACNHAFVDGNKRTAVVAAIHMLNWNGFDFIASDTDVVNVAVSVAEHQQDLPSIA